MSLVEHAEYELRKAGLFDEDSDYGGELGSAILSLVAVFAEQGHSGGSASVVKSILPKLMAYKPLTPLTGTDDEWSEVTTDLFQNRRCSHVFKENGEAYDSQGIVWRDPDGTCCTNSESRVPVTFPYTPKTEIRDRS